jgi:hypothetical protein
VTYFIRLTSASDCTVLTNVDTIHDNLFIFVSNQTALHPTVILDFSQVTLVLLGTSGKTGLVGPDGCK